MTVKYYRVCICHNMVWYGHIHAILSILLNAMFYNQNHLVGIFIKYRYESYTK